MRLYALQAYDRRQTPIKDKRDNKSEFGRPGFCSGSSLRCHYAKEGAATSTGGMERSLNSVETVFELWASSSYEEPTVVMKEKHANLCPRQQELLSKKESGSERQLVCQNSAVTRMQIHGGCLQSGYDKDTPGHTTREVYRKTEDSNRRTVSDARANGFTFNAITKSCRLYGKSDISITMNSSR